MIIRKRNDNVEDIENELKQWRDQNKTKVEIQLFPGEFEYLSDSGYYIIPLIYEIKDKQLYNLNSCPNFIKEKFRSRKRNKYYKLKKREKDCLDTLGIEYRPLGCIVYLWTKKSKQIAYSFNILF